MLRKFYARISGSLWMIFVFLFCITRSLVYFLNHICVFLDSFFPLGNDRNKNWNLSSLLPLCVSIRSYSDFLSISKFLNVYWCIFNSHSYTRFLIILIKMRIFFLNTKGRSPEVGDQLVQVLFPIQEETAQPWAVLTLEFFFTVVPLFPWSHPSWLCPCLSMLNAGVFLFPGAPLPWRSPILALPKAQHASLWSFSLPQSPSLYSAGGIQMRIWRTFVNHATSIRTSMPHVKEYISWEALSWNFLFAVSIWFFMISKEHRKIHSISFSHKSFFWNSFHHSYILILSGESLILVDLWF